jgi:hypothetical protein
VPAGEEGLSQKELFVFCATTLPNELDVQTIRKLWDSLDKEHTGQISYETFIECTFPEALTSYESPSQLVSDSFATRLSCIGGPPHVPAAHRRRSSSKLRFQDDAPAPDAPAPDMIGVEMQLHALHGMVAKSAEGHEQLHRRMESMEGALGELRQQVTDVSSLLSSLACGGLGGQRSSPSPTDGRVRQKTRHRANARPRPPEGVQEPMQERSFKEDFRADLSGTGDQDPHSKGSPPPRRAVLSAREDAGEERVRA